MHHHASTSRAPQQRGMVVELRVGERLALCDQGADEELATVHVEHKTGSAVRLRIVAPPSVHIKRSADRDQQAVPSMTE